MKTFELWQVRLVRTRDIAFRSWNKTNNNLNLLDYDLVYSMPCENDINLEELFEKFNNVHPISFKGRSMSVSDLIIFPDTKEAYYVDTFGFTNISSRLFRQKEFELATELVEFAKNHDIYEYYDTLDETTPDIIAMDLSEGKITVYLNYLKDIMDDDTQPFNERNAAKILINKLDEFSKFKENEKKKDYQTNTKEIVKEQKLKNEVSSDFLCEYDDIDLEQEI